MPNLSPFIAKTPLSRREEPSSSVSNDDALSSEGMESWPVDDILNSAAAVLAPLLTTSSSSSSGCPSPYFSYPQGTSEPPTLKTLSPTSHSSASRFSLSGKRLGRPRIDRSSTRCHECETTTTPQWRYLPVDAVEQFPTLLRRRNLNPSTSDRLCLCNACWLRIHKVRRKYQLVTSDHHPHPTHKMEPKEEKCSLTTASASELLDAVGEGRSRKRRAESRCGGGVPGSKRRLHANPPGVYRPSPPPPSSPTAVTQQIGALLVAVLSHLLHSSSGTPVKTNVEGDAAMGMPSESQIANGCDSNLAVLGFPVEEPRVKMEEEEGNGPMAGWVGYSDEPLAIKTSGTAPTTRDLASWFRLLQKTVAITQV